MKRLEYHRAYSSDPDPFVAMESACKGMPADRTPSLSLVFASADYPRGSLARAIATKLRGPVAGCTTAGEIDSPDGYVKGGILLVSIYSEELRAYPRLISNIAGFDVPAARELAQDFRNLISGGQPLNPESSCALLLVDGMSMLEEQLVSTLYGSLDGISLVGGSAGDSLRFEKTAVFASCDPGEGCECGLDARNEHGEPLMSEEEAFGILSFKEMAAVLVVMETTLPFKTFRIQHFDPTGDRLVITQADETTRTVFEINGGPAAEEYAHAVGLDLKELTPQVFAAHPVMLRIGGEYFVRSIQRANPDGSLTFFCAIDTGLVLTVARGRNLVDHLEEELAALSGEVPNLQLILGCDCILRRLELEQKEEVKRAAEVLEKYEFVGFSTYGEQFNGIHVNQTLTGIALGS